MKRSKKNPLRPPPRDDSPVEERARTSRLGTVSLTIGGRLLTDIHEAERTGDEVAMAFHLRRIRDAVKRWNWRIFSEIARMMQSFEKDYITGKIPRDRKLWDAGWTYVSLCESPQARLLPKGFKQELAATMKRNDVLSSPPYTPSPDEVWGQLLLIDDKVSRRFITEMMKTFRRPGRRGRPKKER